MAFLSRGVQYDGGSLPLVENALLVDQADSPKESPSI